MNEIETLQNHIKKLEAENERLKKDLEHARSYKHTIKMRNRNLQAENERLERELKQMEVQDQVVFDGLRKENAKLKCLALHSMSEYCFAKGTIICTNLEFTKQSINEDRKMIHKVNIRDRWGEYFAESYRKMNKALMEGK